MSRGLPRHARAALAVLHPHRQVGHDLVARGDPGVPDRHLQRVGAEVALPDGQVHVVPRLPRQVELHAVCHNRLRLVHEIDDGTDDAVTRMGDARRGGHILVDALIGHGVDTVFCVPGESFLAALDGLYLRRDAVKLIVCRHESGAANMADAYGKMTGEPGVCFVTRGPGASNAAIGVHTAFQDSTPMILFIGQIVGVILLRRTQPQRMRPYKMWLYPLPCALAMAGWLFMYVSAKPLYIGLGLATLVAGIGAFLYWSWLTGGWPFGKRIQPGDS